MSSYEGLRLKLLKYWRLGLADYRRKKLKNTDFTIISNNCWGGMVYESYNLLKESPTIGLFFMAKDYIEFLSDLKGYINGELTFINPEKSRWRGAPQVADDRRFGHYPVGVLSNGKNTIEIFFLHYANEQEVREKWQRRIKRINWDRLLIKFNDQNGCTEVDVKKFMSLPFKNKLFFTCKHWPDKAKEQIVIKQFPKHNFILASYEPFGKSKYIDITEVLNSL
ncbi:putative acetyl transferase [Streptococcus equinus]|uniref:DUF1919 domain-containing protein n=1 Tax=Streptococcus equinus TaxID=1335 RepID=UPI000F6FDC08|nr:DUF1919 domain-containing protein [Streptococcus equinus]VEE22715.1 putative acetyl transferase [Streptococcus equinus]